MKKLSILLTVVLTFGLFATSCNDDDNNGGSTIAPIVGKWNLTKIGTLVAGNEVLIDPPQNENGCSKDYLKFDLDDTVTAGDYDSTDTPCALTTTSGTYVKSGGTLTTVIDGTTRTEEILNLTATELKLKDETGAIAVFTRA